MPEIKVLSESDEPWRQPFCPDCAYSLEGLPDIGNCPECGKPFDRTRLILVGWDQRYFGRRGYRYLVVTIVALIFAGNLLRRFQRGEERDIVPELVMWMGISTASFFRLLARWTTQRPGLTQLFLDPCQCVQIDDMSLSDGNIWSSISLPFTIVISVVFILCIICNFSPKNAVFAATSCLLINLVVIISLVIIYRIRRRNHPSSLKTQIQIKPKAYAWKDISSCELLPIDDGWHRFRITAPEIEFNFPIDTNVRCTEDQASKIRFITRGWMPTSPTPKSKI